MERRDCACVDAERLAVVDEVVAARGTAPGSLIPILQDVQARVGYLPPAVLARIGERAGVPAAQVHGVASFYSQFRLEPVGRRIIKVCHGTACHVQGATAITEALCDELAVKDGGTTADGEYTVSSVACLGCCSLAPVMMIEEGTYGRLTPEAARKVVRKRGK
ncbi:MAG: NADH-quinone oxidoreductase subunit NuoE [Candidatus Eisenbacteria bacterium]|nr:NADH-quinone oxidoreductase subunit NuoE [Candidatus Eisenbacteria bacterium]